MNVLWSSMLLLGIVYGAIQGRMPEVTDGVIRASREAVVVVVWLLSRVRLFRHRGLEPAGLLCPWNSPGKNTGMGCHFLLQEIFSTQGPTLYLMQLLPWQADSLPLYHMGSPLL